MLRKSLREGDRLILGDVEMKCVHSGRRGVILGIDANEGDVVRLGSTEFVCTKPTGGGRGACLAICDGDTLALRGITITGFRTVRDVALRIKVPDGIEVVHEKNAPAQASQSSKYRRASPNWR